MTLKAKVENLDGMDDAQKALYRLEGGGGAAQYVLDVEAVEGFGLHDGNAYSTALQEREGKLAELAAGIAERDTRISTLMIENEARVECVQRGGSDKLLRPHLERLLMVHDGQVVARGTDGKPRQTEVKGATGPMGVKELFAMLERDPDYKLVFGSGAGNQATGTRGAQNYTFTRTPIY